MARGWESKNVEDQISARESESQTPEKKKRLTARDAEMQSRRGGLLRARTRTLALLASVSSNQDRLFLERALADLDARLAELD